MIRRALLTFVSLLSATFSFAQGTSGQVHGRVSDETGGALPGVTVELRPTTGALLSTVIAASGAYTFDRVSPGRYQLLVALVNFAALRRDVTVDARSVQVDVVLHLSLSADSRCN
jgi:Carboxypeptidase regulatory-like domain